jgi:Putative zinc dependent peptidase (DUF5700)
MKRHRSSFLARSVFILMILCPDLVGGGDSRRPPAPLYRDPVFDGTADPSLIWNEKERSWWIFYTNRRANVPDAQDGVRWCHGTDIGIASSGDGGMKWIYRGTAQGLEFEAGRNTFWAPCLLLHGGTYHMYVAYVRGVPADWSGERHIVHYTSRDLMNWKYEGIVPLSSEYVIDAFVYAKPSGGWRMWYKDEAHGSHIYAADSEDLFRWKVVGPVITGSSQEGPAVFWRQGAYWMLVDRWQGMAVLRSPDLTNWTEQPGTILGVPGTRPDDADIGRHGEVVVQGDSAFLFYFTHPFGSKEHTEPGKHRSSLQVAQLEFREGQITCDRNKPFSLELIPPSGFAPAKRPASALELETSDARLASAFAWAKGQALDYVFPASVHGDPVGDWYEAALPGRYAFCMRDVSHQAAGAQALGLAAVNLNMLRKFAQGISPDRDFCTYWEIDKWNRPAPVDYKNDKDFWYNLPANFDVLDACRRQFQWTANRAYIEDPAFLDFYRLTMKDYVQAWDGDGDGIPEHHPEYGNRGLGSYDEGPSSQKMLFASDLLAAQARAFDSYAAIMEVRGETEAAKSWMELAAGLRDKYETGWWSAALGRYAYFASIEGSLAFEDAFWSALPPLYFGFIPAGARRDDTLKRILDREPENIEMESYLPEIFYKYGADERAYSEILKLSDAAKKRREYPEVPFALIGAITTGLMGVQPDARARTVETRSRLTGGTDWVELKNVPVFDCLIDIRHDGRRRSVCASHSGSRLVWKAVIEGDWQELMVNGVARKALHSEDEAGRKISWVMVSLAPGEKAVVETEPARPYPVAIRDLVPPVDALTAQDLSFDARFAERALKILDSGSRETIDELAADPAAVHLLNHARQFNYSLPHDSAVNLVRSLLEGETAAGEKAETCRASLDYFSGPMLDDPHWVGDVLRYLPPKFRFHGTLFLTFGYDIGVALAPNASLNGAHEHFAGHPRELLYYAIHELHHVGFQSLRPPPRVDAIKTAADVRRFVEYATQMEGLAVAAAWERRSLEEAVGAAGDYVALGDENVMQKEEARYFELYDGLLAEGDPKDADEVLARIDRFSSGDRLWYRVGARMAAAIERKRGRAALVEMIGGDPARFIADYRSLRRCAHCLQPHPISLIIASIEHETGN